MIFHLHMNIMSWPKIFFRLTSLKPWILLIIILSGCDPAVWELINIVFWIQFKSVPRTWQSGCGIALILKYSAFVVVRLRQKHSKNKKMWLTICWAHTWLIQTILFLENNKVYPKLSISRTTEWNLWSRGKILIPNRFETWMLFQSAKCISFFSLAFSLLHNEVIVSPSGSMLAVPRTRRLSGAFGSCSKITNGFHKFSGRSIDKAGHRRLAKL